jgi:hypothetical protein
MPHERTFREDEVAEIFEAAAAAEVHASVPASGLTLAELQTIGGKAGLAPERIAQAAAAVELRRGTPRRTELGLPIGVSRAVDLPRAPTDHEWEVMVADLRETFGAQGRVVESWEDGREWKNGNLHARVEPTAAGYRLRLWTTQSEAVMLNRLAMALFVAALLFAIPLLVSGVDAESAFMPLVFLVLTAGTMGMNAARLLPWARERETQMEAVAARTRTLLATPPARY